MNQSQLFTFAILEVVPYYFIPLRALGAFTCFTNCEATMLGKLAKSCGVRNSRSTFLI